MTPVLRSISAPADVRALSSDERLALSLDNDTSLGVMRYADAGYADAIEAAEAGGIRRFALDRGDA